MPITNLAEWLGNDDYTKSDMSITGQKHFGFDGIAEPVNVEIHLTKKVITEQRTVTIHLYERDSNGNPVKDSNGNYVSVAPDLKATFNYQQDEFVNSKGKVVKKSNIWLWDEKAPKTYDGANSQEVNVGYVEGVQSDGVTPIISNVKCWKVPINKEGTSYTLVPNDGNWSTVEFSTPAVDGYYANPFIDNIVNGYPLLGRPANLFVNPRFNNSVRPGTSDTSNSSIAYTNQDGIYENENEHIIWYFPKENTATIKRTINFVKNDDHHTQLQESNTQNVNLSGSLVAADPNGADKDYFSIYPAEYNDPSIVTGSPIAVINNNKPTYSWRAKDGQTSVNTDITGYTVSAVKIGNADYSTNENDIKYVKEIAQNTATLNSPTDLNISFEYAPDTLTNSYQFVDDDKNEASVKDAVSFSGQTGETVDLNIKLPANYELAKGSTLPTSYTFKPSDNKQLKIHLVHQKETLSDDTKTISRKVTITDPDGKVDPKSTTQSVTFSRSDTLDKVTNQHIYGKWNTKQQALPAIILPVFAGYTPSGKVDAINVTADSNNPADINISYIADKQNSSYKFVDDNENKATVGTSHPISGTTDETIDLTKAIKDSVPTNYDLVPDQKMSYTFKASDNDPLIINLTHHISKVVNDPSLTKTVRRTILITNINGKVDKTVQEHTFTRTGKKDMVTEIIKYGPWSENGKYTFAAIPVKAIEGYAINGSVPEVVVTPETKDSTINISYLANGQTSYYQFIDDDYQTGDPVINQKHSIAGKTGENVKLNISIPENYSLIEGSVLPTSYTFESGNKPIIIHLIHQKESLPNDTKTISRKVTIIDPDGKVDPKSTTQLVTFNRNDILDKVTNKHIYGKWNEAQQTLPSIDLPSFNGYTPTGEVTAAEVTTNSGDIADINISYVPNEQTSYYEFVDDDNHESLIAPATVISGRTGETIKLNIVTPNGYALAKDITLPRSYRFKATNNEPIIIHLVHHMSKVTNGPKLTKVITRTINVINPDGTTDSIVQTVRFVQTATKDDVTNSVSYMNDWKNVGAESFAEYNVPEIAGYTSSKTKVEKLTPKFGDQNVIVNIDYIKKSQINPVKPVKPIVTPIEKDNKEQSANKQQTVTAEPNSKPKVTQEIKQPVSKPNKTNGKILERKDRQTYKFQGQTVTMKKVVNAKEAGHINKIKAKKAALPQTGNDEAKTTAIIASGLAVDLSLIGLAGLKKKRSN